MRFAKLALERYGRFEGCELSFPAAQQDLHIVYGANEAGKTTALAAISDLLFGFPTRSPYNFLFDYSLLRVGALIEEAPVSLACRRRKAGGATLVDANDGLLDEGPLLAMLRGQTRDTFRLSFSLDQEGLRRGGRAMVEAKNDLGQALFAAGSGLTAVAEELARIEAEADSIWGPRKKASRTYTQSETELETSLRAIRDDGLKPRIWADAKKALEMAEEKLSGLETERDALLVESRKAERIRRIAGSVRLRADLLAKIEAESAGKELSVHVEAAAEAAMAEAEAATRQATAAEKLLTELDERAKQLVADPAIIEHADTIERFVLELGAVAKAARDLERLKQEQEAAEAELVRLRTAAGTAAGASLTSTTIAVLRELALAHAQDVAALNQIAELRRDLDLRRAPLVLSLQDQTGDDTLDDLVDAVDAARRLGADADARRDRAMKAADDAAAEVGMRLARLSPWTGDIGQLRALPIVGQGELEAAKETWADQDKAIAADEETARRHDEEAAKIELQIAALPTEAAVSADHVAEARSTRSLQWSPIRAHVVEGAPLDDPQRAVDTFEAAIDQTDALVDRRFALADASGRLSALEANHASRRLEASQARERAVALAGKAEQRTRDWETRLRSLGLPPLAPIQLESWLEGRAAALEAEEERGRKAGEAGELEARYQAAIAALRPHLSEKASVTQANLADILAKGERLRSQRESRLEQWRADQQQLEQIDADIAAQERRRVAIEARTGPRAEDWQKALAGSSIDLDIAGADARLSAIDAVRQAAELAGTLTLRIDGIRRDAENFGADLSQLADRVGLPRSDDHEHLLQSLRSRLQQAQTTAHLLDEIAKDVARRTSEKDEATAKHEAAMTVVTPLYSETETADFSGLAEAIERSRSIRRDRAALAEVEAQIVREGDGLTLDELVAGVEEGDIDQLTARTETMTRELATLNAAISEAAKAHGEAERAFNDLEDESGAAANAASDAEQARAEMAVQAETYILKRAQALALRWAIEEYRQRHQDPLLVRASELFSTLTLGRYSALKIELDDATPRLLGITDDGRTAVDVTGMSEGTTDQLFLALRLAAVEQSVAAGVRLPFLADDLFVNFDDERAAAGFRVLAELAQKTQVLFFTHHIHLAAIARQVVGDAAYSECVLS